jgi:PHD/YefM family antitoxin component YafN of YafNO toxin-antitoxin module
VPLTEARARLFPLVEDLLAGRTDRVALSRRGADQDVLLLRARDVERMEAELAALRRRVAPEPRPLMGYGTVVGEVDDILRDIRREANERFEAKLADIFGDAPSADPRPSPTETGDAGAPSGARPARRRRGG